MCLLCIYIHIHLYLYLSLYVCINRGCTHSLSLFLSLALSRSLSLTYTHSHTHAGPSTAWEARRRRHWISWASLNAFQTSPEVASSSVRGDTKRGVSAWTLMTWLVVAAGVCARPCPAAKSIIARGPWYVFFYIFMFMNIYI